MKWTNQGRCDNYFSHLRYERNAPLIKSCRSTILRSEEEKIGGMLSWNGKFAYFCEKKQRE